MKKALLLIYVIVILSINCFSQCYKGITTNPNNPVNNERPNKTNTFDWRAPFYDIRSQYITTPQIESPFNQSNNLNVNHFLNNPDMLPQDGWELIKYETGYNDDGTPKATPVGFIHLILYNKFTGILRVFVAGDRPVAFNGAKLEIKFASGTMSSALSNASEIFSLDTFKPDPSIAAVSEYNNNNGRWFYADFQVGYDPCTCIYESSLVIQIRLINKSTINLSGSIKGELTSIENGTGSVAENSYSFNPSDLVSVGKKAQKSYKDMAKFVSDQEKALGIKPNIPPTQEQASKKENLNSFQEAIKNSTFLRAGLAAAPYIAGAVELVNFFIGGGKESTGPTEVKVSPMALNATIDLKGELEANYLYGDITFYTPGSKNSELKHPSDYPYYNEILGVFNLLRTPKIYYRTEAFNDTKGSPGEVNYYRQNYYKYECQLPNMVDGRNNIQYVLNPAAGLDVNNIEIYGQLVFHGGEVVITDLLPIEALHNFSMVFGYDQGADYYGEWYNMLGCSLYDPSKIELKLFINISREDRNTNTQNVLFVGSYPVMPVANSSFTYSERYCNIPPTLSLSNMVISNNCKARESIHLTNVSFTANRTIKAKEITVGPSTTIPPNVTITASYPFPGSSNIPPASSLEISSFCNSSSYSSLQRSARTKSNSHGEYLEDQETNEQFQIYPNMATTQIFVEYNLNQEDLVNIYFTDLSGRIVLSPIEEQKKTPGLHKEEIDISNLKPGLYLCTYRVGALIKTRKVIIK